MVVVLWCCCGGVVVLVVWWWCGGGGVDIVFGGVVEVLAQKVGDKKSKYGMEE